MSKDLSFPQGLIQKKLTKYDVYFSTWETSLSKCCKPALVKGFLL